MIKTTKDILIKKHISTRRDNQVDILKPQHSKGNAQTPNHQKNNLNLKQMENQKKMQV
jgi:hypothetical protein